MTQIQCKSQALFAFAFLLYAIGCLPVDPIYAEASWATRTVQETCIYQAGNVTQQGAARVTLRMEIPPSSQKTLLFCWPDVALKNVPNLKNKGTCDHHACEYVIELPTSQTKFIYRTRCWGSQMGLKQEGAQIQRSDYYRTVTIDQIAKTCVVLNSNRRNESLR